MSNIGIYFFKKIVISSHMYPENPEGTRVIPSNLKLYEHGKWYFILCFRIVVYCYCPLNISFQYFLLNFVCLLCDYCLGKGWWTVLALSANICVEAVEPQQIDCVSEAKFMFIFPWIYFSGSPCEDWTGGRYQNYEDVRGIWEKYKSHFYPILPILFE